MLIDALLPLVSGARRDQLLLLLSPQRLGAIDAELADVRRRLDVGDAVGALGALERLPTASFQAAGAYGAWLRAAALYALERHAEAVDIDWELLARPLPPNALSSAALQRSTERLILGLMALHRAAEIVTLAALLADRDPALLSAPAVQRAIALARCDTSGPETPADDLLALLRGDPADAEVAGRLWQRHRERPYLAPDDQIGVLRCLVDATPRDADLANLLSTLYLDKEDYAEAYGTLAGYLATTGAYHAGAELPDQAAWAVELAREAVRQGSLPESDLADAARQAVTIHRRAEAYEALGTRLDDYVQACMSPADRLWLLEQVEDGPWALRTQAAEHCFSILAQQRGKNAQVTREAALLLESLNPGMLNDLMPLDEQTALYRAEIELDLTGKVICFVGGTAAARQRAITFLSQTYGLVAEQQRQIEPFEGNVDRAQVREAVRRLGPHGARPVDVVVHVPDYESHAIFYALRDAQESMARKGQTLSLVAAAGAGSTSMIRAIEAYYSEREPLG
jgi:hypothetical protein